MIRRGVLLIVALVLAASMALAMAAPAEARRLIGCDSLLEWPCPGPAL